VSYPTTPAPAPSQPSGGSDDLGSVSAAPAPSAGSRVSSTSALVARTLARMLALAPALWWYAALPAIVFFATLLPRLRLAHTLDIVTDESVYIPAGGIDLQLLREHNLASPLWLFNYEAPALPKLIIGLGAMYGDSHYGVVSGWLFGARLPAAWLSALTLVAVYFLAWPIFGRRAATLGSLALALSPWLAFFGALAYLDTYLLCFMTLVGLFIWHAARRPWLYPVAGLFAGLAFASKYTAAALALSAVLYLGYHFALVARRRPPWQIVLLPVVALLTIYITDPTIWINPVGRLWDSMLFQYDHASSGHDVFWNGGVWEHVPPGVGMFILIAKLSLFLTVPAALTLVWAGWRVVRARRSPGPLDERAAFALFWLGGLLVQFGALPIVVGTHYMLPLAPATALIAAWGLTLGVDWLARRWASPLALWASRHDAGRFPALGRAFAAAGAGSGAGSLQGERGARLALQAALTAVVAVALIAPPAYGLRTIHQAEGYTAEWLNGENSALQVAYPGYADGVNWVVAHSSGRTTVTLIGTRGGLDFWKDVQQPLFPKRIRFSFGTPDSFPHSQFIIWPEHLVQRRFPRPANFDSMVVARIQGGSTTYCYILLWPNPDR
jgi:4-amino-4-deoxy-L-arabinose transferase-like glycosyltransferase